MTKRLLFVALLLAAALALVAQQSSLLVPIWNGKAYSFPRLGPTLAVNAGQLDALIPPAIPGPAGAQGQKGDKGDAGPQGPAGSAASAFPYLLPNGDLDLGSHNLIARTITATAPGFQISMSAGPAPADTGGSDAVMFFDSSDQRLKLLKKNGDLVLIELTPPPQ